MQRVARRTRLIPSNPPPPCDLVASEACCVSDVCVTVRGRPSPVRRRAAVLWYAHTAHAHKNPLISDEVKST